MSSDGSKPLRLSHSVRRREFVDPTWDFLQDYQDWQEEHR